MIYSEFITDAIYLQFFLCMNREVIKHFLMSFLNHPVVKFNELFIVW